ncbi:MAG: putative ABC transporter ATP-binding protein [Holosporales bacterium]
MGIKISTKTGDWYVLKEGDIGYLDQHYSTLNPNKTVFEILASAVPNWPYTEIRRHLNDFLFRKNEEVNALASTLLGGEKAGLSLSLIAAKTPKLLTLDEITNNLDLETKDHVAQVLKSYPGSMIIICHDTDFLKEIGIDSYFNISNGAI